MLGVNCVPMVGKVISHNEGFQHIHIGLQNWRAVDDAVGLLHHKLRPFEQLPQVVEVYIDSCFIDTHNEQILCGAVS